MHHRGRRRGRVRSTGLVREQPTWQDLDRHGRIRAVGLHGWTSSRETTDAPGVRTRAVILAVATLEATSQGTCARADSDRATQQLAFVDPAGFSTRFSGSRRLPEIRIGTRPGGCLLIAHVNTIVGSY